MEEGLTSGYGGDDLGLAAAAPEPGQGWTWSEIEGLADALEHVVGLEFRDAPDLPPDASESQLAKLVATLDAEGYDAMWPDRRQWRMNEAFGRGEFGAVWNDGTRAIELDEIGPRVHVPIFNATLSILEARLNSTKPELVVAARSTDQGALDRAKAADRAARSQYQELRVDNARLEVVRKLTRKGTVFGKLIWNPQGGKYLGKQKIPMRDEQGNLVPRMDLDEDPMSPTYGELMPVLDADGVPEWEVEVDELGQPVLEDAWEGCNELAVIDPENVTVDPDANRWDARAWHIHRYFEGCSSVERRIGFKGIRPDGKEEAEDTTLTPGNLGHRPGRTSGRSDRKTALVRELYIQAGRYPIGDDEHVTFPEGWIIVECQGQVRAMPNPYGSGPMWMAKADVDDERLHGGCIANEIRGIQATFTAEMSNWSFANQATGNPRIFWPAAAGTPEEEKVGTPGAIIEVEGIRTEDRPYILEGVSVPAGVQNFVGLIFNDVLGYISGVREGGLAGGVPPNVEAAQAFEILGERDATRLATTSLGYGLWMQQLLEQIVWNLRTFAREPRLYAMLGADMKVEVEEFAGADVDEDFQYIVVPESIRPQSEAVKRQSALQLFQLGLATRRDTLIRLKELDGEDAILEQRLLQHCKREAREALEQKMISTPLQLMQFEDHELALDAHRADLFDQRFDDDPLAQAMLLEHCQIHAWFLSGMMTPFPGDPSLLAGFMPAVPPGGAVPGAPGAVLPPGGAALPAGPFPPTAAGDAGGVTAPGQMA